MKKFLCLIALVLSFGTVFGRTQKTIYATYILHGNMNYDRYVRPVIWKEFPVIYDGLLDFMDEHPEFKGQLQFSGQTFASLQQAAPQVIEHAKKIHERGQLNFTGTFYSEPVNVNMDGWTNWRCAWLGTRIIEDNIGSTDGFYLQERAYHPQLPWILNHSNVSWTPVITNDDSYFPFKLRGLDGSLSVCVPITRENFISKVETAPANALVAIEEDYEIPQTFTRAYWESVEFNAKHKDVKIEWITVKEYISRFGVKSEKFVDHSAKVDSPEKGTYSRWTADPLDIIVQNETNRAMYDFRTANALDAISSQLLCLGADQTLEESGISLTHDPLIWDIERAELYPEHEKYLHKDGRTTVLSKSEHLLLWAVNSDAKGWFPLYEKRRERINSLQNSINLSSYVTNSVLDAVGRSIKPKDYDTYYIVLNPESDRETEFSVKTQSPVKFYEIGNGKELNSHCTLDGSRYISTARISLPAYGYKVVGTRSCKVSREQWTEAREITNGSLSLKVSADSVIFLSPAGDIAIHLDDFLIKPLTHMDYGQGYNSWRKALPYGPVRTEICTDGLHPRLRMEWQPDWLAHVQQTFTLKDDRLECSMVMYFPHPCVIRRKLKENTRTDFSPEGLDLVLESKEASGFGYDIPFGISEMSRNGTCYFCPLTSCFVNHPDGGGYLLTPSTGEQAFSIDSDKGLLKLYLGASTTSGPIRKMGLTMPDKTTVEHDFEWYAEPFHGQYRHNYTITPFAGNWRDAHIPEKMRADSHKPYVRQISPRETENSLPYEISIIGGVPSNVVIEAIFKDGDSVKLLLNEREGRNTDFEISIAGKAYKGHLNPFDIKIL